jgi:hypothetical protein
MVYAGFYVEILNANPLNPIKLTLVSPSAGNRQLAKDCSPANPMLIHDRYIVQYTQHKFLLKDLFSILKHGFSTRLKVSNCEIFDLLDSRDFYSTKPLWVDDLGIKIKIYFI